MSDNTKIRPVKTLDNGHIVVDGKEYAPVEADKPKDTGEKDGGK